jgi:hypothetical protein
MSGNQPQNQGGGGDPSAALAQLLGDDAKLLLSESLTKSVMETALKELTEETMKERVEKGKVKLREAIAAEKELTTLTREFNKKTQAQKKKLGKLLNTLRAVMQGKEPPPDNDGGGGDTEEEAGA